MQQTRWKNDVGCLGFIGTGAMTRAIAGQIHHVYPQIHLRYLNPNFTSAKEIAELTSGQVASDVTDLFSCDAIILAVKPQIQSSILGQIKAAATKTEERPLLISIAAGRNLASISLELNNAVNNFPLARVMPNVCAQVGLSSSAVSFPEEIEPLYKEQTLAIFSAIGFTTELPEASIPAFTAMAGSSPAWFAQIVESLARAGLKHGLTKKAALQGAIQSLLGTASMLQILVDNDQPVQTFIDQVCSPGGTTIAGLLAAEELGLTSALMGAVDACITRDRELA